MKKQEDKLYMTHWRFMRSEHLNGRAQMCEEWFNDFETFRTWALGNGYKHDDPNFMYTLQRKDKTKSYCPENCFFRIKGIRQNETIQKEKELLTKEQITKICNDYVNTLISTRELAKKYNVCQRTIMNVLNKNGITAKDRKTKVVDLKNEEWRLIPGFGEKYYISNLGRVKALNYKGTGGESLMQPSYYNGYKSVSFHSKNGTKALMVHRLVAEAFIANPNNYEIVNHKNEVRDDNRVENLEWCTQDYNVKYSRGDAVLAENIVTGEIRKYLSIQSTKADGFDPSLVCKCCKGERITHGGYVWRYEED